MNRRQMRQRIANLETLDRLNQTIIRGNRRMEQMRHDRDMRWLKAAVNREPITIAGVRYEPARESPC